MQKRKKFLSRVCSFALAGVMVLSTVFTSGSGIFTSADELEEQEAVVEGTLSLSKLDKGGKVNLKVDGEEQIVQVNEEGKTVLTDVDGQDYDVDVNAQDGFALNLVKEIGTLVDITVEAEEGYSVATYRILSDSGEEVFVANDIEPLSREYKNEVEITEEHQTVEVTFVEDEKEVEVTETEPVEEKKEEVKEDESLKLKVDAKEDVTVKANGKEVSDFIKVKEGEWILLSVEAKEGVVAQITFDSEEVVSYIMNSDISGEYEEILFKMIDKDLTVSTYAETNRDNLPEDFLPSMCNDPEKAKNEIPADFMTFPRMRAVGDSVYYWKGGRLDYGQGSGMFTNWMEVDSRTAYCAQPNKTAPGIGHYPIMFVYDHTSAHAKAMYNLYGGEGFEKNGYKAWMESLGWDAGYQYSMSHVIMTVFGNNWAGNIGDVSGSVWIGLSAAEKQHCWDFVVSIRNREPAPVGFEAFMINQGTGVTQAIFGSRYKPNGSLQIGKKVVGPYTNNINYGTADEAEIALYTKNVDGIAANTLMHIFKFTNGVSDKKDDLPAGTYYMRETKVPKGVNPSTINLGGVDSSGNTNYREVTVEAGGFNNYFVDNKLTNTQVNDPFAIILRKQDPVGLNGFDDISKMPQGGTELANAEYTVKYYASKGGSLLKTWVFKTGSTGYFSMNNKNSYVGGDSLYLDQDGDPVYPLGHYSVQETKAPTGYLINPAIYLGNVVMEGNGATWKWEATGNAKPLVQYNEGTKESTVWEESVILGGLEIEKQDDELKVPQGDADLSGIQINIINRNENPVIVDGTKYTKGQVVKTITTKKVGDKFIATTGNKDLPYGDYGVQEVKTNGSYLLTDGKERTVEIRTDGKIEKVDKNNNALLLKNHVREGGIEIEKRDKEANLVQLIKRWLGQGDGDLENIEFTIYNRSKSPIDYKGKTVKVGDPVVTIKTKVDGNRVIARTERDVLPYGTYGVKETKTNNSYHLTDGQERLVQVYQHNTYQTGNINGDILQFDNVIKRGGVKLTKVSANSLFNNEKDPIGDATLAGAEFSIRNDSKNEVIVDGKAYKPGEVVKVITTNKDGFATTASNALPYGTYYIWESKASKGYKIDTNFKVTVQVREEGKIYDLGDYMPGDFAVNEPEIRGDVQVEKQDKELELGEAIGGANHGNNVDGTHLEGIEFTLVNKSTNDVEVDGVRYKPGKVVKKIYSHWNEDLGTYTAETTGNALPYGTYTVQETKTNDTYLLTDGEPRTFTVRKDGTTTFKDTEDNDLIFRNQVVRGEFKFVKIRVENHARIAVPFLVTNLTTGESHVIVTDKNGQFDSSRYAKTQNTNTNDKLKAYGADDIIPDSELVQKSGVWFGLGEDGTMAKADDNLSALPYGRYSIQEMKCETNESLELISFEFYIEDNNYTVDFGTLDDEDLIPELKTKAIDSETKDHISLAGKNRKIIDTVSLKNLQKGDTYTLDARFMDYDDEGTPLKNNGRIIKGQTTFVATKANMEVEVELNIDASEFAGKSGVIYETLSIHKGMILARHEDIEDADQTIHFPEIQTTAEDNNTGLDEICAEGTVEIKDTVSYSKLIPNKEYTVSGILMDKETNQPLIINKEEVKVSKTFTPTTSEGTVELVYELDASELAGKTIVVFEDIYYKGILVGIHADIEDEGQTIHFPEIETDARDINTNTQVGTVSDEVIEVADVVTYRNLTPGREYTLQGRLMIKETGELFNDGDHDAIEELVFTPEKADGTVEMIFEIDSISLGGKSLVAYQELFTAKSTKNRSVEGMVKVATHCNIDDARETIDFPEIQTTAIDGQTEDHVGTVGETTIIDKVKYTNLIIGQEYSVSGILMDKDTGKPLGEDLEMEPIKATTTFVADKKDGFVELVYTLDASLMAGKTAVVFEDLIVNEKTVYSHADLEDKEQTVHFPEIRTQAKDKETELQVTLAEGEKTIVDTVAYNNLIPGQEYTVKGILMNKETGEPLLVEDKEVKAETTFTPEEADGTVELEFTFDGSALKGTEVVVFERLYHNEINVVSHTDIEDEGQTVRFPEIGTKAYAQNNEFNETQASEETTFIDVVEYKSLKVGLEYTVKGKLMVKSTGEPLLIDGEEVIATTVFTPEEKDGTVELIYTFDSSALAGEDIVVFEDVYHNDILVGTHSDIEDEGQTVRIVEVGTQASDKTTGTNEQQAGKDVTIVDKVYYKGLIVGKEYTVKGKLMNKATNEPLVIEGKEVIAEKTFTVEKPEGDYVQFDKDKMIETADGFVELEFTFDSSELAGQDVVVFEDVYRDDILVATHSNIEDEGQTVKIIDIGTTAKDQKSNGKTVTLGKDIVIVDTVKYTNLTVGKSYKVEGVLMDKATGKELSIQGTTITGSTEFKPEKANGEVDVLFTIPNTKEIEGRDLVVFETLKDIEGEEEVPVAEHKDIEDKGQTVKVPRTPVKPRTQMSKTGENILLTLSGFILVLLAVLMLVFGYKRRKSLR